VENDGLAPVETDPEEERIFKSYDVVRKCKIAITYVEGLSDPNPEKQKHERSYDQHHRYWALWYGLSNQGRVL
jgi:hypothetical protein